MKLRIIKKEYMNMKFIFRISILKKSNCCTIRILRNNFFKNNIHSYYYWLINDGKILLNTKANFETLRFVSSIALNNFMKYIYIIQKLKKDLYIQMSIF